MQLAAPNSLNQIGRFLIVQRYAEDFAREAAPAMELFRTPNGLLFMADLSDHPYEGFRVRLNQGLVSVFEMRLLEPRECP